MTWSTHGERSMSSSTTRANYVEKNGCRLTSDFEHLRHSPFFSGLNPEVVKLFAYLSVHRICKTGEFLVEQGQKADKAFIVVRGSAEITVEHRGRRFTLQRLEKNTFFGELALLAQFKWFFNAVAGDDTEVIIIGRTAFQKVIEKFPEQKDKLIERLVQLRVDRLVNQTSFMLDQVLEDDGKAVIII